MKTLSQLILTGCFLSFILLAGSTPAAAQDCNSNGIDDACDLDCGATGGPCDVPGCGLSADCNSNAVPDECDLSGGTSQDCDGNAIPDECDMVHGETGCSFTRVMSYNGTGADDSRFTGPPDDMYYGLGGQIVTYHFDCGLIIDGPGPDITLYEVDWGSAEFNDIERIEVSPTGATYYDIKWTEGPAVNIPGDEQHGSNGFARSYDLDLYTARVVRYVRIDGVGTGASGSSADFDLDALGAVTVLGRDCDGSGILDDCESLPDCNLNGIPDTCEMSEGLEEDCNNNGTIDQCDVTDMTSADCNGNLVPDECEPDCDTNGIPDECDIDTGISDDCNGNRVPDSCDLTVATYRVDSPPMVPVGSGRPGEFTIFNAFAADGDVTLTVDAVGDFDAADEYLDVQLNGTDVGRLLDSTSTHCSSTVDTLIIPQDTYNDLVQGGDATFRFVASSAASTIECLDPTVIATVRYDALIDCNGNGALDQCDINAGSSDDVNTNGIPDECEPDCNANGTPDDYDVEQGISPDCNTNGVPDECDTTLGTSPDCNTNGVPDECEPDCNTNGVADECDIRDGNSMDCDLNRIPDECDMAYADGCIFPPTLAGNMTGAEDGRFTGPPDDVYYGLGGDSVSLDFDCGFVVDGPGPDFTVYEADSGTAEFHLMDVWVYDYSGHSVSVKGTETAAVNIPGDEQHGSNSYARSYDLEGSGLGVANIVTIYGTDSGSSGPKSGFDLDAVGTVHREGRDCDSSGTLDLCEGLGDCDGNKLPDICEILYEGDCNNNDFPDDCDLLTGASTDCNHNFLPDDCDIADGTSQDCDLNDFPDECPYCPDTDFEVSYIMDVSDSMDDEGAALCENIVQVAEDLEEDEVHIVENELMAIMSPGTGAYSCLTESVAGNYGTTVPGSPPPGNETLGDCPGGVQSPVEDWGRAISVVAGWKPWLLDSIRLIVPLSDEGTWCGDPTSDPGYDRDALVHAIWAAQTWEVIVSPITCSGSDADVIGMAQEIADQTGGQRFSSTLPAEDLADGLKEVIYHACDAITDCNHNDIPDVCEIDDGIVHDCDGNGIPDVCEEDCNGNGYRDSCDISWGTSDDLNSNAIPDECEVIDLTLDATDLTWTAVDGAVGYDVVRGDLILLQSSAGDFSAATEACMANDLSTLATPHTGDPALNPGEGYWYLVRAALGTMNLGYETFMDSQDGWRDGEILASGMDCP